MAESMRALAASVQAPNDRERLFGEYPQRRRYNTGDAVRMRIAAGSRRHTTAAGGAGPQRQVFPEVIRQ